MKIEEMINLERIKINVEVKDWKEAIQKVGELMLKTQCVHESYINAMTKVVENLGPCIVITPGVAFTHVRPEDGVIKIILCHNYLKRAYKFWKP